jgi:hypothetical protein
MGLDARLRGHDVLLALDLRNRHLVVDFVNPLQVVTTSAHVEPMVEGAK